MEKQFVPFDLALKLRNLGFDEPCLGWHWIDGSGDVHIQMSYNQAELTLSIPLWQQAFDWFEEKYNLTSSRIIYLKHNGLHQGYWKIVKLHYEVGTPKGWSCFESSKSDARFKCLEKLIKLVEQGIDGFKK